MALLGKVNKVLEKYFCIKVWNVIFLAKRHKDKSGFVGKYCGRKKAKLGEFQSRIRKLFLCQSWEWYFVTQKGLK